MDYSTIVVGLLVSLLLLETIGLYPGGIIVPAYLVLYIGEPVRLMTTVLIALATMGLYRFVSGRMLVFGRRRFVFMIVTAALLTVAVNRLVPALGGLSLDMRVIGVIIPGLIASNAEKQGIVKTLSAMCIATSLVYLILQVLMVVR